MATTAPSKPRRTASRETRRRQLIDACIACPVDALFVFDEQGTQLVPGED